ncbi:hypothetical protein MMC29_002752, partial [Sticta canariensis]|nr:hypothetical protein [Sticta canariensis]
MPKGFNNSRQQQQFQTLLKAEQLDVDVKKALRAVFSANIVAIDVIYVTDNAINAIDDSIAVEKEEKEADEDILNVQHYVEDDAKQSSSSAKISSKISSEIENLLKSLLQKAYQDDPVVNNIIAAREQSLQKLPAELTKQGIKLAIEDLTVEDSGNGKKLHVRHR